MPARRKTLAELVAHRSFRARRHADRLLEPPLRRHDLRALQAAYAANSDYGVREAIARAFERASLAPAPEPPRNHDGPFFDAWAELVERETGTRPRDVSEGQALLAQQVNELIGPLLREP